MNSHGKKHYLGIDFGTSNSYFCLTSDNILSATPIVIDGHSAIASALLWETQSDGVETLIAFGDHALEEWGLRSDSERKKSRISAMFKPEIGDSEEAYQDAHAFLHAVLNRMKEQGVLPPSYHDSLTVILGSPANRRESFERRLIEIGESLGIGRIRVTPEPVGALINHVATRNEISPGDAKRGVLVIDFGGGTCDIAYMLRLEIKAAWGDVALGGRLFDDLFYQWFLDENPGAVEKLSDSQDEYYVHWINARLMKERFSATMDRNNASLFTNHIHVGKNYYGGLQSVSWSSFELRARAYKPCDYLRKIIDAGSERFSSRADQTIDLIDWFRDVLISGMMQHHVNPEMIQYVILTGGSSAWPFVRDTVMDVLKISRDQLFYSANPMTAVGEGVALLPVIQSMHSEARKKIKKQRPDKMTEIEGRLKEISKQFAETLSAEISDRLVNNEVRRVLSEFSRTGGTGADLSIRINEVISLNKADSDAMIQRNEQEILVTINREILLILEKWFNENGMRSWSADRHYMLELKINGPNNERLSMDDPMFGFVSTVTGVIMTVLAGNVLGGGGIALLMAGLPGLILGALVGAGVYWAGFSIFKNPLQSVMNRFYQPSWLASRLMNDKRLDKMVHKVRQQIHASLLSEAENVFEKKIVEIKPVIDDFLNDVIDDLSALDHL